MKFKTIVFYGSYRSDRQGIKAARFMINQLKQRNHEVIFADAKEYDFGILDRMYKEYGKGQAPAKMEELAEHIRTADGFVVVAGEYNHSIQPGLSNLMDHYLEEYFFRPAGIVCYSAGSFGGVRAAIQLRAFLSEMGMPTISSIFAISKIGNSLDEAGISQETALTKRVGQFLDELEWYEEALQRQRKEKGNPF
ncbi:NADPH-dependent FMN reductase [Nostoc sp. 'Peltigera membranacea cyanobiont' 210A]|uniref:NADPH-dependent FMN reductase n=1 Tax=Nostoc sp. 'Peltigera membranacea cyanobiont' 210A TaxID=2014529 RepID=UPI000B958F2C|nr:NAD(P)H-dependent oxidoreductase [Nostoc sp. 'Peltigera membranacea cyanobiont' 210A]OYD93147.1 NADPH-dependent FMN reductase [Nostoc sp. 'Peltigera membranacea cyanobiont' 210A]